jgi:hypothetical protein
LVKKKNAVAKSKEVKTQWSNFQEQTSLAESSKESYGSKRAAFANDDEAVWMSNDNILKL